MALADDQMKRGWVHGHGHIREYTMKEVVSIIESSNFTILKKEFISPPPDVRAIKRKCPYEDAVERYREVLGAPYGHK